MASGQDIQGQVFLSAVSKKYLMYTELHGGRGTVFHLGWWLDKGGSGKTTIYVDTITRQPGTGGVLFSGKKTTLRQEGDKLYIIAPINKKIKKIEIGAVSNTDAAYTDINNAYWWHHFNGLVDSIHSRFPMYGYSFRNGFGYWNSFQNKTSYYKDFQVYADAKIKLIYDSIAAVQTPYTSLTDSIIKSMAGIDYSSLKASLDKLPVRDSPESVYFSAIVKSVCLTRPELFFKLAEDMPDKKNLLFDVAVYDKEISDKLVMVETSSPAKKEFLKARKDEKSTTRKSIFAAIAGAALMATIAIALIK
jgi:hypothetical protein